MLVLVWDMARRCDTMQTIRQKVITDVRLGMSLEDVDRWFTTPLITKRLPSRFLLDYWIHVLVVFEIDKENFIERLYMASKKATNGKTVTSGANPVFGGYVNISLTDVELGEFDHMLATDKPSLENLMQMPLAMGKLALNRKDGTYSATVTEENDGKLYSLSAFSDDMFEAIALLVWKMTLYPKWCDMSTQPVKKQRG